MGPKVGRHRVARLMRTPAFKAKTRRGFRPCRTGGRNPLVWLRTCCSSNSSQQPPIAAGPVTSPTSAPQRGGGT
jgi:hypothetical protein